MRAIAWIVISIATLVGVVVLPIGCWVLGYFGEAAQVAREEFGPRELLRKYEWFKDQIAGIDKVRADIEVYEKRLKDQEGDYGEDAAKWPRDVREQRSVWRQEVAGIVSRHNDLVAEYNAQMAKFNWRFTNAGDLPKGASEALPRELREYRSN